MDVRVARQRAASTHAPRALGPSLPNWMSAVISPLSLNTTVRLWHAVLVLSSCGAPGTAPATPSTPSTPSSSTTSSPPASTSSPPASTSAAGDDQLTIKVRDVSGARTTWRLTCSPPGGTHPDPAKACGVLTRNGATALPPVPRDRVCSQLYGGPETATVTGTWRGRQVSSTLSRQNGCESSRWNALVGLLPAGGR